MTRGHKQNPGKQRLQLLRALFVFTRAQANPGKRRLQLLRSLFRHKATSKTRVRKGCNCFRAFLTHVHKQHLKRRLQLFGASCFGTHIHGACQAKPVSEFPQLSLDIPCTLQKPPPGQKETTPNLATLLKKSSQCFFACLNFLENVGGCRSDSLWSQINQCPVPQTKRKQACSSTPPPKKNTFSNPQDILLLRGRVSGFLETHVSKAKSKRTRIPASPNSCFLEETGW